MAPPGGFDVDFDGMWELQRRVLAAGAALGAEQGDFEASASLDRAVPEFGGDVPMFTPGIVGPRLDEVSAALAQIIRQPYAGAAAAVQDFVRRSSQQIGGVAFAMDLSIREYERVESENAEAFPPR